MILILMFFMFFSSVYAYFVSSTDSTLKTGTALLDVGFKSTSYKVNSTSITLPSHKFLPGDDLSVDTTIANTGSCDIFCILQFRITVNTTVLINKYYTISNSQLVEIINIANQQAFFIDYDEENEVGDGKNVQFTYAIDNSFTSEDYAGKTISCILTAHAIQADYMDANSALQRMLS